MVHVSVLETAYLIGAMVAFVAFALTLFTISIYARSPQPRRVVETAERRVERREQRAF